MAAKPTRTSIARGVAVCATLAVVAPSPAAAQEAGPIAVGGIRPTADGTFRSTEIKRLRESQGLRDIVATVTREITRRQVLNHSEIREAIGSAYLVTLFDCQSDTRCVSRVFAPLRSRATLLLYGDYAVKRRSTIVRMRLIDLATGKLVREAEFSLTDEGVEDREVWRSEMEVLLSGLEAKGTPAKGTPAKGTPAKGTPPPTGDGGTEEPGGAGEGGPPEGGEEGPPEGGEGTEVATGPEEAPGGGGPDEMAELDQIDAELDVLEGGGAGKGERALVSNFRGALALEFRSYPLDREGPEKDEQLLVESDLELDVRIGKGAALSFRPRFLIDTLNRELIRFEPYAGYFQYTSETWDFRAGQFVENWGIADTFNPIDVLNRRDYAPDMLDPTPLGELGGRLRKQFPSFLFIGEPTFSIYVLPVWRPTLLPDEDYRYSFSQPGFVLVDEPVPPDREDDAIFAAARLEHTINAGIFAADIQYIAARGPARFPTFIPTPQVDGTVQLVTEYYGNYVYGGGLRLVPDANWWSKLTLRGEVAYSRPYQFDGAMAERPDEYVQYAAGFDRAFNHLFSDLDALLFTVEYLGENRANDLLSDFRPFDRDVAFRFFWEAKDFARTSVELRGVVDVTNGEAVGLIAIGRQLRFLHDDLRFEIIGQGVRPYREEEGFFSFFPNNSNVRTRMEFNF